MSNPTYPNPSGSHHNYPPTSADWVTSPLAREDEIPENPLEPPPSSVGAGLHMSVLLLIGGGLLALVALFLQIDQKMTLLATSNLWPALLLILRCGAAAFAVGAAARGVSLLATSIGPAAGRRVNQAISLAFAGAALQIVAILLLFLGAVASGDHVTVASWVTVASAVCLLLGGCILRFIGQPSLSSQERAEQADEERRTWDYTRGDKFIGGWRRNWNPPQTGD